mgnify:CR=1 FL=1
MIPGKTAYVRFKMSKDLPTRGWPTSGLPRESHREALAAPGRLWHLQLEQANRVAKVDVQRRFYRRPGLEQRFDGACRSQVVEGVCRAMGP